MQVAPGRVRWSPHSLKILLHHSPLIYSEESRNRPCSITFTGVYLFFLIDYLSRYKRMGTSHNNV